MPQIGSYSLHAVETGRFGLDGGAMFGIVPKPLWARRLEPDQRNRIPLHLRCLLLEGENKLILIDAGIGEKIDEKFRDIYAVDHEYAALGRSLRAAGFTEADVTDVVLTHLHFDHCGGTTKRSPNGVETAFPNADVHVQRKHWEWACNPNLREQASFLAENLEPIAESGRLRLVDGDGPLFPGVEVITVDGHTEAQQLVKVQGEERAIVFVADLLPTTAHLRPAWIMAYDVRPLVTLEEKRRFLDRAVEEGWHFFFEHDPHVVVATPVRTDRGIDVTDARPLHEL